MSKNKVNIVLVLISLISIQSCVSQNKQKETTLVLNKEIDSFINFCYSNKIFNGSALVIKNDTLIYKKTVGFENYQTKDTLKETSKFYIASVSKPFTSLAIMQLKEKGLLDYDDLISNYVAAFNSKKYKHISIRHLLTHTSGIPDHYDIGMTQKKGMTNDDVIAAIVKRDLRFETGSKYGYSNAGYIILTKIVEKVSKQSFRNYMKEHIFDPIEMIHSTVADEFNPSKENLVQGISKYGDPHNYPFFTTGSGGVHSTVEDLMLFDRALYSNRIIAQETLLEAFKPFELNNGTKSNYGLGWNIVPSDAKATEKVFHTGGAAGYASFLFRDMKSKHTVIFLASNRESFNLNAFADALTGVLYDKKVKKPKIPISIALNTEIEKNTSVNIEDVFDKLKKNDTLYEVKEDDLNDLGYHLLDKKKTALANSVFKINVDLFPESWNVYDSYGESFLKLNDIVNAKKNYLKSFRLNPEIKNPEKELKKVFKNH